MTATNLSTETFFSERQERFLQTLPIFFGLCLTLCMPIVARKSLIAWRAVQVYDSQQPPKKGFTGERKKKRWEFYFTIFCCIAPSLIQLIAFIPIENHVKFPIYTTIRRNVPFAILAVFLSMFSFNSLSPLILPIKRVGRDLDLKVDKKTKEKKVTHPIITLNSTKPEKNMARFVLLFSIVVPILIAHYFANSSGSTLIVVVMASASSASLISSLVLPMPIGKVASLRQHVKFFTLVIICALLFSIAFVAIIFAGVYVYLYFVPPSTSSNQNSNKNDEFGDMIMSQVFCLSYTAMWPLHMAFPAFLMNLAYRFDVSRAGFTQVTDEQKKEAIRESREVAKHCRGLKHPDHNYDNVGRTPIVLDAVALRLPQEIQTCDLPIFSATMTAMIFAQIASLLVTWLCLPSSFNVPYFVRSEEAAKVFPIPFTVNFGVFVGYLIIVPAMLFSAAYQAKRRGETIGSGLRAIWTYEETWGVDYSQTKIDHQMGLMDTAEELEDEKEEQLLADPIKEDLIKEEEVGSQA